MKNKNIFKIITGAFIMAMVFFAGCQKMEVIKVIGFIQGHAFDGNTNTPLDSVKVVWFVAGEKDSTIAYAEDGYLISDLPAGDYSIWCSKASYTTVLVDRYIGSEDYSTTVVRGGSNKEQIITYNPNLYPLNAGLTGRLYKSENGVNVPITGATVQLDYNSLYEEAKESYRFIPGLYEAITDANGYYVFTNVPASDVYLRFLDYTDANGETYYDGNYSHGTSSRRIYMNSGSSYTYSTVVLTRVTDNIQLINTNAFASTGVGTTLFDVTSDITLTFNKDVNETSTLDRGYVVLQVGGIDVASTVTFSGSVITINPDEDLSPNTIYTVSYSVYSSQTYDVTTSSVSFSTVNNAAIPAQVTSFGIAYDYMGALWLADYNTTGVWFSFDRLTEAISYEIFARDNYNNTEYIKVGTYNQADYLQGLFYSWAVLPSQFDYYFDDGIQTPFSHGTDVSYKIRAVNSAGAGAFSTAVTITDEIAPDAGDIYLREDNGTNIDFSDLNNSAGVTPLDVTIHVYANNGSYFDVSSVPTVRVIEDNGGLTVNVLATGVTFINHQHYTFEISIPAGDNFYGGVLEITGLTDSSENSQVFNENFQ